MKEAETAREETFNSYDMTDPKDQIEWAMLTGFQTQYIWEEAYYDLEYFDSCEIEARIFYTCSAKRFEQQEAFLNYRKIYLSYDLINPEQQREWALMGLVFELEHSTAYDELITCEKSVYSSQL